MYVCMYVCIYVSNDKEYTMSTNLNQVESRYHILDFLNELDFVGSIKFYKLNCELCWFFFPFFRFYLLKKKKKE